MKEKSKRVKELILALIRIDYNTIMNKNKYSEFALLILDKFNEHFFIISEHAMNNYVNLTRFFLEAFLNEASKYCSQNTPKNFFRELEVIKAMTNKITTPRIEKRWKEIFTHATFTEQELKNNE
jgi:hypothetical protein